MHSHSSVNVTSSTQGHTHPSFTGDSDFCRSPHPIHQHQITNLSSSPHSHSLTVSFGDASLGSPNWWEHKHPITATMDSKGSSHVHSVGVNLGAGACADCSPITHRHTNNFTCGETAFPHTHVVSGWSEDADPSGTPFNHTHSFLLNTAYAGGHVHTLSGSISSEYCALEPTYAHSHTETGLVWNTHRHSYSGISGSGGESEAAYSATSNPLFLISALCVYRKKSLKKRKRLLGIRGLLCG